MKITFTFIKQKHGQSNCDVIYKNKELINQISLIKANKCHQKEHMTTKIKVRICNYDTNLQYCTAQEK